ncbi:hypothetical protein GCM10028804_04130 [Larkinella terrae]
MVKDNTNQAELEYKRLSFNQNAESQIKIQFEYDHDQDYKVNIVFETKINESSEISKSYWIYQDKELVSHKRSDRGAYDTNELKSRTGELKIYKPDSNRIDKPGPVGTGEEVVNADASNIVGFLDLMLSRYRRNIFDQIELYIHQCIPEFDEIKLDDVQPNDNLKKIYSEDKINNSFKRFGLANGKQNITFWSNELSEGTLYFLALLCIIHQPNPPKLLLLEEPEKGIHPRRIKEVVNFIFRLADEKDIQVIMTTHSPIVLDMFKDMPESVFIFDKNNDEGATKVKNLQRDVIEPDTKRSEDLGIEPPHYTDSLGDSWTVGFLGGVPK